jgi:hypothetical protein
MTPTQEDREAEQTVAHNPCWLRFYSTRGKAPRSTGTQAMTPTEIEAGDECAHSN